MIRPRKYGGFGMGDLRNANLALLTKWGWKYKARQEALWAIVIKAIHENKRSQKYLPLNKGVAGVWKDILASFEELNNKGINVKERLIAKIGDGKTVKIWLDSWAGGLPFNERYPDLFKIVKNKQSTVAECATKVGNEIQWNFKWNRPPISDAEWNQWSEMLNVLNKVKIETRPDRWGWKNQDWETFTVAAVKELIEKQADSEQNEQWSHWNTWVPAKINYFVWRASLGRIAVKQELKKRDIILNSDLCSRCGRWEESVEHLISECITSKEVWRYIIEWLKLPTDADVSSCKRIMEYPEELKGYSEWKKVIKAVFQTTIWQLWKSRNEKEFKGCTRDGKKILEDVKEEAFLWLKCRSKLQGLVWERWVDFNIRDIIK
ncbi:putative reverse transcriptase zinc-binding domain-containing protein [Helianthus annuus]|nr:putative reverse transcriptase zinc-binding domain-containing protein [Helianthus annuus]